MALTLILDNLRSTYNVGSILRTANAVGIDHVICVGTTPYPAISNDPRPGHVASRNTREIAKTALGAETSIHISYESELSEVLHKLRESLIQILALEQSDKSMSLFEFKASNSSEYALILGNEVNGVNLTALMPSDIILEIPMKGSKESLNVSVAAGIAMYQLI